MKVSNLYMQGQWKSSCNNLFPLKLVIMRKGKCLVALLEARQATVPMETRRTAYQDVMNLTSFSRVLNHGAVYCARYLISREKNVFVHYRVF